MVFLFFLIIFNLLGKIKTVNYNIKIQGFNFRKILSFLKLVLNYFLIVGKEEGKVIFCFGYLYFKDRKWFFYGVFFFFTEFLSFKIIVF